jgi:hypothetical protein
MATEAIDFEGYEYGLWGVDNEIIEVADLDTLRRHKRVGERIAIRATYTSGWFAYLDEPA